MWLLVAAITLLAVAIGGWETWTVRYRPELTITFLIKRYTHLALIVGVPTLALLFLGLGYALHAGGC